MKPVKDVDEYIALAPKEVQDKLKEFEQLSRSTPAHRNVLVMGCLITITKADWFISDFQKNILDFTYPLQSCQQHKSELKGYGTTKATVRFPLDKKLPVMLIKKLIKVHELRKTTKQKRKNNLSQYR